MDAPKFSWECEHLLNVFRLRLDVLWTQDRGYSSISVNSVEKYNEKCIFRFNPSPFQRMTFWTVVLGNTVAWMGLGVNQAMVQKFMSLSSHSRAIK
jgi:hypothetical protein